jgi:Cof subfamily protein (haloacid dehalogenase superfamily)
MGFVDRELELRGVVLDLDGTALRSDHSISPQMAELGRELREHDIWLTLASARPPRSVRSIGESLQSKGPWIALNGAVVLSGQGEIVWRRSLPPTITSTILDFCSSNAAISFNIYSGFDWIVGEYDARIDDEARIVGFQPAQFHPGRELPDADKILLIAEAGQEERIRNQLTAWTSEIHVSVSKPTYIEITHRDVDKATALSIAARAANVSTDSMLAAGDGENDISMLSLCGLSVAMAHSPEAVRRSAKKVVGTNDDDSLPQVIRSLISKQRHLV